MSDDRRFFIGRRNVTGTSKGDAVRGMGGESLLLARARQARRLRATMAAVMPPSLLLDPAWDLMLDLLIAFEQRESLCVKDVVYLSGENPTSALRRLDKLQASGLLRRTVDPHDHRRTQVELTPAGRDAMARMLDHLFDLHPTDGPPARPGPRSFRPEGL